MQNVTVNKLPPPHALNISFAIYLRIIVALYYFTVLSVQDLPKFVHIEESINRYDALPGLESVRSTIYMRAAQDLFKNGKMKLKCTATMFHLYSKDTQTELIEEAPLMALVMVSTTPSNDGNKKLKIFFFWKFNFYVIIRCKHVQVFVSDENSTVPVPLHTYLHGLQVDQSLRW